MRWPRGKDFTGNIKFLLRLKRYTRCRRIFVDEKQDQRCEQRLKRLRMLNKFMYAGNDQDSRLPNPRVLSSEINRQPRLQEPTGRICHRDRHRERFAKVGQVCQDPRGYTNRATRTAHAKPDILKKGIDLKRQSEYKQRWRRRDALEQRSTLHDEGSWSEE